MSLPPKSALVVGIGTRSWIGQSVAAGRRHHDDFGFPDGALALGTVVPVLSRSGLFSLRIEPKRNW